MSLPDAHSLARALGRIPSGLFVVTTLRGDEPVGFLGSFVMQAGLRPPMLTVAVGRERPALADLRATGRLGLSVLDESSRRFMAPFLRRAEAGETPFTGLELTRTESGLYVLAGALAWVEARLVGEHPAGDHVVLIAECIAGQVAREGEPHVHLRRNGLAY
jgi:flavin reductase (DIM6/NTAB) family NADH-FMN oxidoreductase RutF